MDRSVFLVIYKFSGLNLSYSAFSIQKVRMILLSQAVCNVKIVFFLDAFRFETLIVDRDIFTHIKLQQLINKSRM